MNSDPRPSGLSRQEAADCSLLAGLFRFVAGYFLAGPSEDTEKVFVDPEWRHNLVDCQLLAEDLADERMLSEKEHGRQFLSTFRIPGDSFVPPFEQAYRKGKATVDESAVSGCTVVYESAGYELAPFKQIQTDHIGHQARFVAAVLEQEADCLEREDIDAAATVATWRTGFLQKHCAWWSSLNERVDRQGIHGQIRLVTALAAALAASGRGD